MHSNSFCPSATSIAQMGSRISINTIVDRGSWQVAGSCGTSLLPVLRTRPAWLGSCFAATGCAVPLLELLTSSTMLDEAAECGPPLPATAVATRALLAAGLVLLMVRHLLCSLQTSSRNCCCTCWNTKSKGKVCLSTCSGTFKRFASSLIREADGLVFASGNIDFKASMCSSFLSKTSWQYSKLVLELEVAACPPACDAEGRSLPCAPLHCPRSLSRCAASSAVSFLWLGLGPEARKRLGSTMDRQLARLFYVESSLLRLGKAPACSNRYRPKSEHRSKSWSTAGCTTPMASGEAGIARPELEARAGGRVCLAVAGQRCKLVSLLRCGRPNCKLVSLPCFGGALGKLLSLPRWRGKQ